MSVLFTFPGQGAQRAGMLHTLPVHARSRAHWTKPATRSATTSAPSTPPMRCAPPWRSSFACWSRASLRAAG